MIYEHKADADKAMFIESVDRMLERLKEVEEKFKDDQEGLNHHTIREIQYWFRMSGQVNNHF